MFNNIKKVFLYYGVIFLISSLVLFTAFNWQNIGNIGKISIPLGLTIVSSLFGLYLKKDIYKNLAYLFSAFSIGAIFATMGQVYQTGADSWMFFMGWSIFLIIPMVVSKFYIIVGLFTGTLYTALLLFMAHETDINNYYSTFFLGFITILYPLLSKKIKFNDIYYYTVFLAYILLNRGYRFLEFKDEVSLNQDILALVVSALIYVIGYVKEKRVYIYPMSLINLGLIVIALIDKIFDFRYIDYIFWLLSLVIFVVILYEILRFSQRENLIKLRARSSFSYMIGFTKIMIIIFAMGVIESIFYVFQLEEIGKIFISLILFFISWYSYKVFKSDEKKCEIILFSIGLVNLIINFSESFGMPLVWNGLISLVIFDLFYYYRYTKIMDYFLVGFHSFVIVLIMDKINDFNSFDMSTYWIELILFIISFGIITLSIIYKNKIEMLKNKERIVRILRGNEIYLIGVFIFSYKDSMFYKIPYSFLYVILATFIIFKESINRELKIRILSSILVAVISYICLGIPGVSFGFLLFLVHSLRKEKIGTWLVVIMTTIALVIYYYSLEINLLSKSILLLEASVISFVVYLVWKYFFGGEIVEK